MLHLLGYDDRTDRDFARMHGTEDAILTALGFGPVFAAPKSAPAEGSRRPAAARAAAASGPQRRAAADGAGHRAGRALRRRQRPPGVSR
jgi:hypothetical protein